MALYPCSIDGARYQGKQSTLYVSIVRGTESQRARLRICPGHLALCQDNLAEFKVDPTDGTAPWFGTGAKCVACLKPMDEVGWQFFGTCYPANKEREDYWGGLHDDCSLPSYLSGRIPLTKPTSQDGAEALLDFKVVSDTLDHISKGSRRK